MVGMSSVFRTREIKNPSRTERVEKEIQHEALHYMRVRGDFEMPIGV
jgi:hypothetical protein